MTSAELQAKLSELLSLPAETEWVEFKEAKNNYDFDDLGKYFSALSNEANLKGQPFGWLVFGVKDKPLGFVVSFALLTFFIAAVMYRRPVRIAATIAVASAAGFYLVFPLALGVSLPVGMLGF